MTSFRLFVFVGVLMLGASVSTQAAAKLAAVPKIGKRVVVPKKAEVGRCMSSPGQLDRCFRATANGVMYTIAYRPRGARENVATYVHTNDPEFKSPEGLRVGDVIAVEDAGSVIAAPGFEIYARKGKGWIPVVGFNGEVEVVQESQADEKRDLKALGPAMGNPIRLRIKGFTVR